MVLGEDDGVPSPHKKHRSHREHRAHSSRLGKRGRGGRVEGGGGSSEMENAIAKTLEEKHKKSRQLYIYLTIISCVFLINVQCKIIWHIIDTEFKVEKSSVTFADVGGCQSAIKACSVCACVLLSLVPQCTMCVSSHTSLSLSHRRCTS